MLFNLVGNALKFTERGLRHDRRDAGATRGGWSAVRRADSGIGIPDDKLRRMFERFAQADESLAPLRRHRPGPLHQPQLGGIDGRSPDGHQPRRRRIAIRSHDSPRRRAPETSVAQVEAEGLDGLRILVADDHPIARRVLAESLTEAGARAAVAGDVGALRKMLAEASVGDDPYDVLLLDHGFDEQEDEALVRSLRAGRRPVHGGPIVLFRSIGSMRQPWMLAAGVTDSLVKPARATRASLRPREGSRVDPGGAGGRRRGADGRNHPTRRHRRSPTSAGSWLRTTI